MWGKIFTWASYFIKISINNKWESIEYKIIEEIEVNNGSDIKTCWFKEKMWVIIDVEYKVRVEEYDKREDYWVERIVSTLPLWLTNINIKKSSIILV